MSQSGLSTVWWTAVIFSLPLSRFLSKLAGDQTVVFFTYSLSVLKWILVWAGLAGLMRCVCVDQYGCERFWINYVQSAAQSKIKSFERPSYGFRCCACAIRWQPVFILIISNLTHLMQWHSFPLYHVCIAYCHISMSPITPGSKIDFSFSDFYTCCSIRTKLSAIFIVALVL